MKITIQKRETDKNGHRALRLVYYHGSKTWKVLQESPRPLLENSRSL